MSEKPPKKPRDLPPAVRDALREDDYRIRHKKLSALGKKGDEVANEHRREALDRAETLDDLAQQRDVPPPRDIVNDEGDVVPFHDYLETREQP